MTPAEEETAEAARIVIEALGDATEVLAGVVDLVDTIQRRPGYVPDAQLADLYAWASAVTQLSAQMHHRLGSTLKNKCIMSGPIVTSNGGQGWKATQLGHASRMGGTYRLDQLSDDELGELT